MWSLAILLSIVSVSYSLEYPLADYAFSLTPGITNKVDGFCGDSTAFNSEYQMFDGTMTTAATSITVMVSLWVKPEGYLQLYQGTSNFSFKGKTITYGSISTAKKITLKSTGNWINLVIKVRNTGAACIVDKIFVRQLTADEIHTNSVEHEFFSLLQDTNTAKLLTTTSYSLSATFSTTHVQLTADAVTYGLQLMGKTQNAISTVFNGDFNLDAISDTATREEVFNMVVQGRPKPSTYNATFLRYSTVLYHLLKLPPLIDHTDNWESNFKQTVYEDQFPTAGPIGIDEYMNRTLSHDKLGFHIFMGEKIGFYNLSFNYDSFSNSASFEMQVELAGFVQGKSMSVILELQDNKLENKKQWISRVKILISQPDSLVPTLLCEISDQIDGSRLLSFTTSYNSVFSSTLTIVYTEGFGLLYSDHAGIITERSITVTATDGFTSNPGVGYYVNQSSMDYHFLVGQTNTTLNSSLNFSCPDCGSTDIFKLRLVSYQLLCGAFSPMYLSSLPTTNQIITKNATQQCPHVLNRRTYALPSTFAGTIDISRFACSRQFTQPDPTNTFPYANHNGKLALASASDANCLAMSADGTCLVCKSPYYNEFSGTDTTTPKCFFQSSCLVLDSVSQAYIRNIYQYTMPNGSTRVICHKRPEGCMVSVKPSTCDLCEPFKNHRITNYTCQCALLNCKANKCDQSACEECEDGYKRIFIERSTGQFQCVKNSTCTKLYGNVLATNITTPVVTPWCKQCDDEFCGDCETNFLTCNLCLESYFKNSTNRCVKCDDTCKIS